MNKQKNHVMKSKSSNSAIGPKTETRKTMKSRSHAEIKPLMLLKRRGVYVANKATKLSVKSRASSNVPKKQKPPPPVPRANRKRFLNSVLSILSKSTAGTQYPDVEDHNDNSSIHNRRCERIKFRTRKTSEDETIGDKTTHAPPKKKQKYRSKILNDHKNDLDKLVILQSRKEIVQTPSSNSHESSFKEPETIKWSEFLPPLVNNTKEVLEKCIYDTNDGIAKHVLEGLQLKEKKVKLNVIDNHDDARKEDKGLYNFFVDLLETTFNIYNVKPEYDSAPITSITSSKMALEIDECVAKKLQFEDHEMSDDVTQKPSNHFCCVPETADLYDNDLLEYVASQNKSFCKRPKCSPKTSRKLTTRSFTQARPPAPLPKAQSVTHNYKKTVKRSTKKELLHTIKEQLRMETNTYEEPQNLFEALKLMASNKRRYQKSIHFGSNVSTVASNNTDTCVFKRRKLISFSTKSNTKRSNYKNESEAFRSTMNNYSDRNSTIKKALRHDLDADESEHSLEVYGFDYDSVADRKDVNRHKQVELMYHSTPSQSNQDFNINEALLKYSESGTSSVQNYMNWNHGIQSVTKVMKQI